MSKFDRNSYGRCGLTGMHVPPQSVAVTGMHMHCVNVRGLVLRSAGRRVAKFRYEQCTAVHYDSSKCRSGTQERELGVQLVTFSSAVFLMWYYFAIFSTKTFECSVSPPTFRQYSDSRWPVISPIICILCKERSYMHPCTWFSPEIVIRLSVKCLTKSVFWNAHRVSLSSVPVYFLLGLWCVDLICPGGLSLSLSLLCVRCARARVCVCVCVCVGVVVLFFPFFTVPKLISKSFSQRAVKPILRRPVSCDAGSWIRNSCPSLLEDTPRPLWALGQVSHINTINIVTGNDNGWLDNIGVLYSYFAKCRPTMHWKCFGCDFTHTFFPVEKWLLHCPVRTSNCVNFQMWK